MTLGSLLSASAAQNPKKTAIVFEDESISYDQLDRSTTSLARWLLQQGCVPGDRVGVYWQNSIETVKLFWACFKAGMIAVPVNVRMKAPEIAYVLKESEAVICFAHPDHAAVAREAGRVCTSLRRIYTALGDPDQNDPEIALPEVNANDPALILYTSGTTARPKGVTHSHRTLFATIRLLCSIAPDSMQTFLVISQMAYVTAFGIGLVPAIATGAALILLPAFDAPAVLDLIERFQCNITFAPPSMVQQLLEEQERKPREVRSMRTFFSGGDCVPVSTQKRFQALFGIPMREIYGMTETPLAVVNPADAVRPGSFGKIIEGVELSITDPQGCETLDGQIGEVFVRSPANFVGYWKDPAATLEALHDGWVRTGDLARRDSDGYLWFAGRKKEIIVRDGLNISPQEVEEAIYHHPAVLEVAVIGMPDPIRVRGERVLAFVSLRDGLVAGEREIRNYASQRLADFKVPERILLMKDLPKGVTGKVQRRALQEMYAIAS